MTDDTVKSSARAPESHAGATSPPPSFDGDLTDLGTLKRLLARHGISLNKGLGQHLLTSRKALNAVVGAADLTPDDRVLEVGAGPGVLTRELARLARRVVAVELDRAVLPVLRETTADLPNVEIIPRNLLDVQPEEVFGAEPYKLVANLPYYITSLILRHLLESANPPRVLVVMVQREVAERLVAGPGEMSLLALSVQLYGAPRIVTYVPATAFFPPPRVDSAVLRVDLHPAPLLDADTTEQFFALIHAGFAEKRKQLHNTLARHLDAPRETISRWLAEGEIDPMRRAQTLSLDEWLRLARIAQAEESA
ncbi:MAG TPA: 16S rRNA (adenine(1518)-N(6)/adenine(1519)-N(6))-dimethyltransferase RsmA [Ktedonobacterales bacterium]|nr:16S rRNA (adenine(1518)-N(6)/adenine(1519)-N(6))-dimethyltransferase RsmA [Ktedonobacterales bacterium]